MKKNGTLKMAILVISILLIALISFVGIYKQEGGKIKNILPNYLVGKELEGTRLISFKVDDSKEKVSKGENEGNVTENEEANSEAEEVPVNKTEILTAENYELAKNIMKNRLDKFGLNNYDIRVNKDNGTIALEVAEDSKIDDTLVYLLSQGKFQITDTDTKEVLIDNSNVKQAKTMYYQSTTGTTVYLDIVFNDEGKAKLEEISKTYIETKDDEGKSTKKTITIKVDDETITTTYFGQTMSNGELPLTVGSETTDSATLRNYFEQAGQLEILLNNGINPIVYTLETNEHIAPIIDATILRNILVGAIAILGLIVIYLVVRYKTAGIISAIAMIGYIALYLLIIRFTDTIVSLEGMAAIGIAIIAQFMFLQAVSKAIREEKQPADATVKKELIKNISIQIPLYVTAIIFVFANWETISSFGTALFWGLIISVIYNFVFTRLMFIQKENMKK